MKSGCPPSLHCIEVGGSAFAGNFNNATIGGDELFHTESWLTSQDGQSVVVSGLDPSLNYQITRLYSLTGQPARHFRAVRHE